MNVKIDISDVKILEDFFTDLSQYDKKSIFIAAYRKAVKPLVAAAKANAPVGGDYVAAGTVMGSRRGWHVGGGLRSSIGTKELKGEIAILVGAMRPKGAHGHLVEDGTKPRSYMTKKNKVQKSTGKVTATHFFEAAYNATEEQIADTVRGEWYKEIDNYIRKTNIKLS